jgi:hypothetical protein
LAARGRIPWANRDSLKCGILLDATKSIQV